MAEDWNSIIQSTPDGCTMRCKVQPRSSRNAVVGLYDNAVKVALTAPPVDGEANAMLCAFLAKFFGVSKSMVAVKQGETSKTKVLSIRGVAAEAARSKLNETIE